MGAEFDSRRRHFGPRASEAINDANDAQTAELRRHRNESTDEMPMPFKSFNGHKEARAIGITVVLLTIS